MLISTITTTTTYFLLLLFVFSILGERYPNDHESLDQENIMTKLKSMNIDIMECDVHQTFCSISFPQYLSKYQENSGDVSATQSTILKEKNDGDEDEDGKQKVLLNCIDESWINLNQWWFFDFNIIYHGEYINTKYLITCIIILSMTPVSVLTYYFIMRCTQSVSDTTKSSVIIEEIRTINENVPKERFIFYTNKRGETIKAEVLC